MGGKTELEPKVNTLLFLQAASPDEEEAEKVYKSRIADVEDDILYIEVPLEEDTGRLKRLNLGDELSAYFLAEGGVRHHFNTHVIGFRDDVIKLVAIRKPDPDSIRKVQRRSFLRVPAVLELAVKLASQVRFLAYTEDIGGGGISFVTDPRWSIRPGDVMECWLLIPYKNGTIEHAFFKPEVVRVKKLESGRQQIMAKFIEISDSERQKIIRYCFERQLEFRKR
ncbi:MAG: glycosyl transferase [Thermobacillus sp. ZCTH02-B1]|nr:MAG: glycosyl transferase [Thermobacillus sp. ZCTH02-B1]